MMQIRRLEPSDAELFRALRLDGLQECPSAFASSFEEESRLPAGTFSQWLAPAAGKAIFGAFSERALAGCVGLAREGKLKLSHKAILWGMYVAPAHRAQGTGRRLVEEALRFAASLPGVRQVNLGVNVSNIPARRLYESLGFAPYGVEPDAISAAGAFHAEMHMVLKIRREENPA